MARRRPTNTPVVVHTVLQNSGSTPYPHGSGVHVQGHEQHVKGEVNNVLGGNEVSVPDFFKAYCKSVHHHRGPLFGGASDAIAPRRNVVRRRFRRLATAEGEPTIVKAVNPCGYHFASEPCACSAHGVEHGNVSPFLAFGFVYHYHDGESPLSRPLAFAFGTFEASEGSHGGLIRNFAQEVRLEVVERPGGVVLQRFRNLHEVVDFVYGEFNWLTAGSVKRVTFGLCVGVFTNLFPFGALVVSVTLIRLGAPVVAIVDVRWGISLEPLGYFVKHMAASRRGGACNEIAV